MNTLPLLRRDWMDIQLHTWWLQLRPRQLIGYDLAAKEGDYSCIIIAKLDPDGKYTVKEAHFYK